MSDRMSVIEVAWLVGLTLAIFVCLPLGHSFPGGSTERIICGIIGVAAMFGIIGYGLGAKGTHK